MKKASYVACSGAAKVGSATAYYLLIRKLQQLPSYRDCNNLKTLRAAYCYLNLGLWTDLEGFAPDLRGCATSARYGGAEKQPINPTRANARLSRWSRKSHITLQRLHWTRVRPGLDTLEPQRRWCTIVTICFYVGSRTSSPRHQTTDADQCVTCATA